MSEIGNSLQRTKPGGFLTDGCMSGDPLDLSAEAGASF